MPNILFVCTANRCRSPMAERLFLKKLSQYEPGVDHWRVTSAGTWAEDGISPDEKLISVMDEFGIDIRDHQSRMVSRSIIEAQDLILVMEKGHLEALAFEFPVKANCVFLLSKMIGKEHDIEDPFTQPRKVYRRVALAIDGILTEGFETIVQLAQGGS